MKGKFLICCSLLTSRQSLNLRNSSSHTQNASWTRRRPERLPLRCPKVFVSRRIRTDSSGGSGPLRTQCSRAVPAEAVCLLGQGWTIAMS